MAKRRRKSCLYDTDNVARNIWTTLARDFRASEGSDFYRNVEDVFTTDISTFRQLKAPEVGIVSPGRFKRHRQMQSLLKKYRFATDAFSDEELHEQTLDKYFAEQERLAKYQPMGQLPLKVVQRARKIARQILGRYDPEATITGSKFGKKSSIGCSLNLAYIDEKLSNVRAFTGSSQCSRWFFEHVLPDDGHLSRMVERIEPRLDSENLQHESLTLINVPKSWKTYRTITPLTLLSLFYSNGVGTQVTERLQKAGLDIRRLQQRHQRLVKGFSMSKTHATADLSAASDSLTSELLNRVLPREWYCAMKKVMTHTVLYERGGKQLSAYTESVLPMGNGLTFPVETLVFYSIIKAIGELAGIRGVFSVYGDDLIYPSKLHKYVVRVFPALKLVLNEEKTFVSFPFRESCGSDFYRGCDVRPYFLQGERALLTRSQFLCFLYKAYNGLSRRWHELEIRGTLRYLLLEMLRVADDVQRVPPGFPDTAGIKVAHPNEVPLQAYEVPFAKILVKHQGNGNYGYSFNFMMMTAKNRFVKIVEPYYWLALQGRNDDSDGDPYGTNQRFSYYTEAPRQPIKWLKMVRNRYYMRGGKRHKKRLVSYSPIVASRVSDQLKIKGGFTPEWI